jgi:hypothetical protein
VTAIPEDRTIAAYKPELQVRRSIQWARATLKIPGLPPFMCARMLRSAIGEEMNKRLGSRAHSDWLGKDETGECVRRQARICYRYRNHTPQVFIWDDLAKDHIEALAGHLRSIRIDTREKGALVLPVEEVQIEQGTGVMGQNQCHRYLYDLATPIFPTDTQWARRPREAGHWRNHWMLDSIQGTIDGLLKHNNLYHDDITISPVSLSETRVEWSRPQRGIDTFRQGIVGRFIANVELPSGIAIGRHGAEGYGELQLIERYDVPKG